MAKFKQHPIYTNLYVSEEGTYYFIRSNGKKSSVSNGTLTRNKYGKPLCREVCITVSKGKYKVVNVGRLVLETYVGQAPSNEYEVHHIDSDPSNNRLENLQWISHYDNIMLRDYQNFGWKTNRHTKRLATAKALGYETWGDLLKAGRKKAKEKREQNG